MIEIYGEKYTINKKENNLETFQILNQIAKQFLEKYVIHQHK